MDKLKYSKFNYKTEDKAGNIVLYNSLYKTIRRYEKKYGADIEALRLNPDVQTNSKLMQDMQSCGFFVKSDVDEITISEFAYLQEVSKRNLNLTIVPTMQCNFDCAYCYQEHGGGFMSEQIQHAIVRHVRKNIVNYTSVSLSWFGGEPLLRKDIVVKLSNEIRAVCKKHYKPFNAMITTNGYALDLETFNILLDCGVRYFQITLDGTKEIHDKQRALKNGSGTFDRILQNLLDIKKIRKNIQFKIHLRTNVAKEMIPKLGDHVRFLHDNFGDDERFTFFFRQVFDWGGERVNSMRNSMILNQKNELDSMYRALYDTDIPLNYYTYFTDLFYNPICYAGMLYSYIINWDGRIEKCTCESTTETNKFNHIGYLTPEGKFNIDINKEAKWIIRNNSKDCQECFMRANCFGAFCPKNALIGSDNCCPISKTDIDWYLKLLALGDKFITTFSEREG
mgnify:CR=1 FL=1